MNLESLCTCNVHHNDIDRAFIYRLLAMDWSLTHLIYPFHSSMGVRTRIPIRGLERLYVEKGSRLAKRSQLRKQQS